MGYIFDALNKQRGDKPEADAPSPETHEPGVPCAAAPRRATTTLADALASTPAPEPDAPAPLRLADLRDKSNAPDSEPVPHAADDEAADRDQVRIDSPDDDQPFGTPVESDNDDTSILPAPSRRAHRDHAGWFGRLFGRHRQERIDDRLVSMTSPASAVAEEYRSIRTSILARHDNQRNLVHTITSATPQEGKTITCVNLGLSFAELRNRKTIIIECDLRLPTFAKLLPCDPNKPGLINYLRGEAPLKDVIQQVEGSQLFILPAGGRVSDEAVQLLSSARMSQLIQGLRAKFDHVLIDTPPVLQLADAGILGSQSEEVLLVARMRRTPRTLVEQAVNTLTSYNAVVNGLIATDNPRNRGRGYGYKYGYRYGYGYGYGYTEETGRKRRKERKAA
ncbi:MAG: CpsD/CapB family tyrosine-protein kinase [Phycisphaeraceae bacterium]